LSASHSAEEGLVEVIERTLDRLPPKDQRTRDHLLAAMQHARSLLDDGDAGGRRLALELLRSTIQTVGDVGLGDRATARAEPEPPVAVAPQLEPQTQQTPRIVAPVAVDVPPADESWGRLTRRESEILGLIASGRTSADIAVELALSVRTVGRHITNIYKKIGARGRADATAYALRNGLVHT
jgi:DNA-binding CsgD family transcriptional regulator